MTHIRPFTDGDDRALREVLPDAASPADFMARSLLRPSSEDPPLRSVVAEAVAGVPVGAGVIAASPLHPHRAWSFVEVVADERRAGLGKEIFAAVKSETDGTDLAGMPLRCRVVPESPGHAFAASLGFEPLDSTRGYLVDAGALGDIAPERAEDLQVTNAGSSALAKALADWYPAVNLLDPVTPLTPGKAYDYFLSEATGAHGAALLRRGGDLSAFAVSYAHGGDEESPTELLIGTTYETEHQPEDVDESSAAYRSACDDVQVLLAALSAKAPVVVETTEQMPVVGKVLRDLAAAGSATERYSYLTLASEGS